MSERIHVLAQQLFGKSSIDECDLQEIKDLADRYPYFAPAQFLLLEKLKKENAPEYSAQLQKAVLYYHDPLEFEYFISSERFETEVDFEEDVQPSTIGHQFEEEQFLESTILPEKEITTQDFEASETPGIETTNVISEEDVAEFNQPESNIEDSLAETKLSQVSDELHAEEEIVEEDVQSYDEEKMAASIERVLEQEEQQIKETPSTADSDLVFEPYHTVDYFASQGIKLSQEDTSKDKFGKQLKSFTEWLKSMKRLPATEISKQIDPSTETKVQHLAEDSVHQADVVTEAMAEVWIKQGNKEKAIETYNKLGLLNPSKKPYFAALIENLKRS